MSVAVEIANLRVSFGASVVVRDVSLAVARGEHVALIGPSGSGKSTLLRALLGLIAPVKGTIKIDGRIASEGDEVALSPEDRNLAIVFQDLALWPHMSVEANVDFALEARAIEKDERARRRAHMLEELGISHLGKRLPRDLSGGERQRVALARALVVDPVALLLDEPLASLDPLLRRDVIQLLRSAFERRNLAVLHVTHDLAEAKILGTRIGVMNEGRMVQIGAWDELVSNPADGLVRRLVALKA